MRRSIPRRHSTRNGLRDTLPTRVALAVACLLVVQLPYLGVPLRAQVTSDNEFGREYSDLSPEQQALLDDFFARFSEVTGESVDPTETYGLTRMSVRTTFEAVTHALQATTLTDASGRPLGTGLDLIDQIETVSGRVHGTGTDQQFRLYARLVLGARDILEQSQEFSKGPNNFMYHPGYPLSYRQDGGVPSIQISVSNDFARADVDVDYRSLVFPVSLFNGHLTVANSDVRAGDNAERHQGRWEGFVQWWRGLFGLPSVAGTEPDDPDLAPLADVPRSREDRIDRAVDDFLTAWLVEGQPEVAVGHLSRQAYECLALQPGEADPFDYGMAPYRYWAGLQQVNDVIGIVDSLDGVTVGVRWTYPGLTLVEHDAHDRYVIFGVPDELAAQWTCENLARPAPVLPDPNIEPGTVFDDFHYFLSTFYIDGLPGQSGGLALLWGREDDYWKVVSYETDPAPSGVGDLPDLRAGGETVVPERTDGDPALLRAVEGFTESWLVDKDLESTMAFVSSRLLPCVDLYQAQSEPRVRTDAERTRRLRLGLTRTAESLGEVDQLEDLISGVEVWNPVVREVTHDREAAYAVYSLPEWVGVEADCQRRVDAIEPVPEDDRATGYGRYYMSTLRIDTFRGETVALALGWVDEGDGWQIYTLKISDP